MTVLRFPNTRVFDKIIKVEMHRGREETAVSSKQSLQSQNKMRIAEMEKLLGQIRTENDTARRKAKIAELKAIDFTQADAAEVQRAFTRHIKSNFHRIQSRHQNQLNRYFEAIYELAEKRDFDFNPILVVRVLLSRRETHTGSKQLAQRRDAFSAFLQTKKVTERFEETQIRDYMCHTEPLKLIWNFVDKHPKWAKGLRVDQVLYISPEVLFKHCIFYALPHRCMKARVVETGSFNRLNPSEYTWVDVISPGKSIGRTISISDYEEGVWRTENKAREALNGFINDEKNNENESDDEENGNDEVDSKKRALMKFLSILRNLRLK